MPKIFILIFLGVLLCAGTGIAQEKVTVRFVALPKVPQPEQLELMTGDGSTIEVELPSNRLSQTYTVVLPDEWALGKSTVSEDGKPKFQAFGSTEALPGKEQLIFVIREESDKADRLRLVPLTVSGPIGGGGSYSVFNASNFNVIGSLSDLEFLLLPGETNILNPSPSETKGSRDYCYAEFFYGDGENEKQPFYTSTWRLNDKARSFVFFYKDPKTNQLRLHIIRSFVTTS